MLMMLVLLVISLERYKGQSGLFPLCHSTCCLLQLAA